MAGVLGIEPRNAGIKTLCLTAWRHPNELMHIVPRIHQLVNADYEKKVFFYRYSRNPNPFLNKYKFNKTKSMSIKQMMLMDKRILTSC